MTHRRQGPFQRPTEPNAEPSVSASPVLLGEQAEHMAHRFLELSLPLWDHKGQLSSLSQGGWKFAVSKYMCEPLPRVWMGDY